MDRRWVLDYPEAIDAGPEICGGKGWNLSRLHCLGFAVPAGGVVVAEAYRRCLAEAGLGGLMEELTGLTASDAGGPAADSELSSLRQAIEVARLPGDIEAQIRSFLARSGLADVPVAVRSSATTEDDRENSFAGIHSSFLEVAGLDRVLSAIKGCYASLWTPRALAYRRRLLLEDEEVACAVVVCAMIRGPAVEGVAFSCDPRTGRRDRVTISAARATGGAVVGGGITPAEITVQVDPIRLRVAGRSGLKDRVLSDQQALELARLALRVEWALGEGQEPQDLEWVHDGCRFWLLQARPVTGLPRLTFPAIAHLPAVWSNANLKDSLPDVLSTLGWSLIRSALRPLLFATLEAVGAGPPAGMEPARRFAGRAYFDLTSVQWAYYHGLGVTPAETNRELGGHQPEIPVPTNHAFRGRLGWARLHANARVLWLLLSFPRTFPIDLARVHAHARELKALSLSRLSNTELLEALERTSDLVITFCARCELTDTGRVWQMLLEDVLDRVAPGRARALAAALMSGSGRVTSAEHGYRLAELANAARGDLAAHAYLEQGARDPHAWRSLPAESLFRVELERFLAEFGHRGVYEAEIANPRWNEDPSYLLEQVRLLLETASDEQPRRRARVVRVEAEAEVAHSTWLWRPLVRWLASRARQMAAFREAGKSALVAPLEPLRAIALEIGRRLSHSGALAEPADVVHLAREELEAYLRGEWDGSGARALVAARVAQRAAWRAVAPPDVIVAARPAVATGSSGQVPVRERAERSTGGQVRLKGLGVASGRAAGRARVLRHPAEGHRLLPGEVLVAPSTDPGWTPLLLRAVAVVTEVGGYLSHGAIVAREYGMPAVANVPGLLDAVHDGTHLVVDGDTGEVLIEDG